MSVNSYQNDVARLQKEIGDIRNKISSETAKGARITGDISSITRSLNSSSNLSSLTSNLSRMESKNRESAQVARTISDLEKRLGDKQSALGRAEQSLASARTQENKKREDEAKRSADEQRRRTETQLSQSRQVTREYERQSALQAALRRQAMIDVAKLPLNIKVLFCASNPRNAGHLLLDEEVRLIDQNIRASKHRDSVQLISKWALRSTDLMQALNEHEPHVVHFSGHGSEDDEIIFLDAAGQAKFVSKTAIVQMLASAASNLRVVVFNTCFSENQAEEMTQHIQAAIGMGDSIGDKAARNFSAILYSAIGFGFSIQKAFDQAKAILLAENIDEAQTPKLFIKEGIDANEIVLVKPQ